MSEEAPRRVIPVILTAAEARELRRKLRKAEHESEGSPPEVKRALRVLRKVARNLERNRPTEAINIFLHGFGAIMLRKLIEKGQPRS
jgi:hypothetical protein